MSVGHEALRLTAATLAAAAAALNRAGGVATPFHLAFLTDRRRIADPEPIMRALPAGVAVIYRDYEDPRRAEVATRYAALCKLRGLLFLVAGDAALARAVDAAGLHLPARMLAALRPEAPDPLPLAGEGGARSAPGEGIARNAHATKSPSPPTPLPQAGEGRRIAAADSALASRGEKPLLLSASCHDADELRRAAAAGARLALLGPVFPTKSHPGTEHIGPARFKALAAASRIPVLALGGVDQTNAAALGGPNVAGFAAIGAFAGP